MPFEEKKGYKLPLSAQYKETKINIKGASPI